MNTIDHKYTTAKHPTDPHKFLILDHTNEVAHEVEPPAHKIYIRMTERAEQLGGIYLPEKSRDEHNTLYEVIAISKYIYEYRGKERKFRGVAEMDRNACLDIDVGDTIIIPEKATEEGGGYADFVRTSPVSRYEGYIDKGLILAKVR